MHGCGMNTPRAAAVAAITCGLAGLMHIPKVGMLVNGLKSAIVAAGWEAAITRGIGSTTSVDGDVPSAHIMVAPLLTTEPAMAVVYSPPVAMSLALFGSRTSLPDGATPSRWRHHFVCDDHDNRAVAGVHWRHA